MLQQGHNSTSHQLLVPARDPGTASPVQHPRHSNPTTAWGRQKPGIAWQHPCTGFIPFPLCQFNYLLPIRFTLKAARTLPVTGRLGLRWPQQDHFNLHSANHSSYVTFHKIQMIRGSSHHIFLPPGGGSGVFNPRLGARWCFPARQRTGSSMLSVAELVFCHSALLLMSC